MNLDSARELKSDLVRTVLAGLPEALYRARALAEAARRVEEVDPQPRMLALGIARARKGDFRLAVRLQRRALEDGPVVDAIRRRARGEVDVRYIGRVSRHAPRRSAPRWFQARQRPLLIGCSIGHYRITAGTLGAFVLLQREGQVRVLSNNHVLADENRGRKGDAILQPGVYDGGTRPRVRVGGLDLFVRLKSRAANRVDAALAALDKDVDYDPHTLKGLGALAAAPDLPIEDVDLVDKLGRTTGRTTGRVSAIEVDNLIVAYEEGNLRFDGQVEIEGTAGPFSQGGDSGSLIVTSHARQGVALLFAGSDQGGRDGQGLTFANPLRDVLAAVKADLLT